MTNYTIWWHVGDQPTQEIKIAIDAEVLPEYCAIINGELEETAEHLVRSKLFTLYGYSTSRDATIETITKDRE